MANLKNTVISDAKFRLPVGDTAARPGSPNARQIRFNTETGKLEQFRPDVGAWIAPNNTGVIATGGDSVYDVDVEGTTYRVHVFTATGTSTFSVLQGGEVEYLLVGGGGSGGNRSPDGGGGGGGGAGDFIPGTATLEIRDYNITIGQGGASTSTNDGNNGEDTIFDTISTAIGGGGGAEGDKQGSNGGAGLDGASGGGGSGSDESPPAPGGQGIGINGNSGGSGSTNTSGDFGGAGGGAGSPGDNAINGSNPGQGGNGLQSTITGIPTFYAGGGTGGSNNGGETPGGLGGGGAGRDQSYGPEVNAVPNTGGGGGGRGDFSQPSGAGGSGIVIIRYPLRQENPVTASGRDVGNGLVLDLDFAKPTVYSGSGSVVTDSRLNGIEGDIIGSPVFTNPRTHRSAFEFTSNSDYIDFVNTESTEFSASGNWSVGVWMNQTDFAINFGGSTNPGIFGTGRNNPNSWEIWTDDSSSITGRFELNDSSTNRYYTYFGGLNQNQWYFLFVTYNNKTVKTFRNGILNDSSTYPANDDFRNDFVLGRRKGDSGRTFPGLVGTAYIFNRTLTDAEVLDLYNATRWRFGV